MKQCLVLSPHHRSWSYCGQELSSVQTKCGSLVRLFHLRWKYWVHHKKKSTNLRKVGKAKHNHIKKCSFIFILLFTLWQQELCASIVFSSASVYVWCFPSPTMSVFTSDVWHNEAPLCQPDQQYEKEGRQGWGLRAEGVRTVTTPAYYNN